MLLSVVAFRGFSFSGGRCRRRRLFCLGRRHPRGRRALRLRVSLRFRFFQYVFVVFPALVHRRWCCAAGCPFWHRFGRLLFPSGGGFHGGFGRFFLSSGCRLHGGFNGFSFCPGFARRLWHLSADVGFRHRRFRAGAGHGLFQDIVRRFYPRHGGVSAGVARQIGLFVQGVIGVFAVKFGAASFKFSKFAEPRRQIPVVFQPVFRDDGAVPALPDDHAR